MHIYLLTKEKLLGFKLPNEVFGNYSFDEDADSDNKLINIKAENGKWFLYSTRNASVMVNNFPKPEIELEHNKFYYVMKDSVTYIIYVRDDTKNGNSYYQFDNLNLQIGANANCNIKHNCAFYGESFVRVYSENNYIYVEPNGVNCYVDGNRIIKQKTPLLPGDRLWSFGLEILVLNKHIIMNNPSGIMLPDASTGLSKGIINYNKEYKDEELTDYVLYGKDDYFNKSPLIRRNYDQKTLNIENPPKDKDDQSTPVILTIGPMLTMGLTSCVMLAQTITNLTYGETTMEQAWPTLLTTAIMLLSTLMWPVLLSVYNKKTAERKKKKACDKYLQYIDQIEKLLSQESSTQASILKESFKTTRECLDIIQRRTMEFWNKSNNDKSFLEALIGIGDRPLDIAINHKEDSLIDDETELKNKMDAVLEKYKYLHQAPVTFSFKDNPITAVMGEDKRRNNLFINNVLIQFLAASNYEDLKIVLITESNNLKQWEYLKYLNHCFDNEKGIRFIGADKSSISKVSAYLVDVINSRLPKESKEDNPDVEKESVSYKPHYLVICDGYDTVKETDFMKLLNTATTKSIGFSVIISEKKLSNLPSSCDNYINVDNNKVTLVKNNYNQQDIVEANLDLVEGIDYRGVSIILANIPIEFESKVGALPNAITFLEMEKVGKVEQLNVLNRWKTNDPINSLKAEIGVDDKKELMYLDLHEKYHGPHGLIAGTTGSGKSEFIITYILSMCINYSPDYVSFILIDYKGGGLALAFENKLTGTYLPHLAGTITNLDKAEMNRTLVSIDSESKRRQKIFNEARDKLGDSTMDIYKYQKHYKEGHVTEPVPHLFIICDEFAELKSQQPDFMDSLISTARIGRSLGVHLILATQKPSGVVNDQIWSNTKFRVCLKVQDEADSQEMLKHNDAAHITKSGRYYLQVGYDEIYKLGQSGWCGAKYYPSDEIVKETNNEVNFIDNCGETVRSLEEGKTVKLEAQGEQLGAVMHNIIEIAKHENQFARKLWLPNIPDNITLNYLYKKYDFKREVNKFVVPFGEYDAPEEQVQGLVAYDLIENGNTIICSVENSDSEMMLEAILVSMFSWYKSDEVNVYGIDYGSEFSKKFQKIPHVGGFAYAGEAEKFVNLCRMLKKTINDRKQLFNDFGGTYLNYIKNSGKKIPFILVFINNYDALAEEHDDMYDVLAELARDSVRYGIAYVVSCTSEHSISGKASQYFNNIYAFKLKDQGDYGYLLNSKSKLIPRDYRGRGMLNNGEMHEFQVASLVENEEQYSEYVKKFVSAVCEKQKIKAKAIPCLPKIVRKENVTEEKIALDKFPLGITKDSVRVLYHNFIESGNLSIISRKTKNTANFILSIIDNVKSIENGSYQLIDFGGSLKVSNVDVVKENYDDYLDQLIQKVTNKEIKGQNITIFFDMHNMTNVCDSSKVEEFIELTKDNPNAFIIGVIDASKISDFMYESAYESAFKNYPGIYVGKGVQDQTALKIDGFSPELELPLSDDYGYYIQDGEYKIVKLIDYFTKDDDNNG